MTPDTINLRHLRAFCEVARQGSISAASERVHLSQPAITQGLAKIERLMDVRLFDRQSSGMHATEAGGLLLVRAQRALDFIAQGARKSGNGSDRAKTGNGSEFGQLVTASQLRALIAVAQAGNFSLAARETGVSQSALHRMARDLERLSGGALFYKTVQGIGLTKAGEALADAARLAFAELRQGIEEIGAWRGRDTSRIVFGATPLARSQILPMALNEFTRLRPHVQLGVIAEPYEEMLRELRSGDLDFMVGALREPAPIEDVVQEKLFSDDLAIIAGQGHPLVGRSRLSVANLAAHPWVLPPVGTPTRTHFDRVFAEAHVAPPPGLIEASSHFLVRGLLEDGDRLTMISTIQMHHELKQGSLVKLPFDLSNTMRPIGLTMRRNWQPTATQTLLLDELRRVCQRMPSAMKRIQKMNTQSDH